MESDPDRLTLPPWLTDAGQVPDEPAARGVVGPAEGLAGAGSEETETLRRPEAVRRPVPARLTLEPGVEPPESRWRQVLSGGWFRSRREQRPEPAPERAPEREADPRTTVLPPVPAARDERAYSESGFGIRDQPASRSQAQPEDQPGAPYEPGSVAGLRDLWGSREVRVVVCSLAALALFGGSTAVGYVLAQPGETTAVADEYCPEKTEQGHVQGAGEGSTADPMGTVLAFDYAYYVRRDVDAVMEVVAPSSTLSREELQRDGIGVLMPGTLHCVDARTTEDPSVVRVTLRQEGPDGTEKVMQQRVTVAQTSPGRYGVVAITPAG